jgi:hypothetical protein
VYSGGRRACPQGLHPRQAHSSKLSGSGFEGLGAVLADVSRAIGGGRLL